MSRPPQLLVLCALAAGLGASGAAGQSAAAPSAPEEHATPAALAAHPAPASPDGAANGQSSMRAVSSQTATRLTDGMPGYVSQKPVAPIPDDDQADAGDPADQPKNTIIRLPDYVVSERRPPIFTPKEVMTKDALIQSIFKEHPGLNLWGLMPFASLNAPIAKQISDEEDRLDNISNLRDAAITIGKGGDAAQSDAIKKETQQVFMHDVWGSGDMDDGK